VVSVSTQARQRFVEEPSTAFSDFHRTLPRWYTQIDLDGVYYDVRNGHVPYLLVEEITVRNGDLSAPNETHELYEHKRHVYEHVADALEVPAYTLWTTESCDEFVVQQIDEDTDEVERLEGAQEYWTPWTASDLEVDGVTNSEWSPDDPVHDEEQQGVGDFEDADSPEEVLADSSGTATVNDERVNEDVDTDAVDAEDNASKVGVPPHSPTKTAT
jgi:hypothetical protein